MNDQYHPTAATQATAPVVPIRGVPQHDVADPGIEIDAFEDPVKRRRITRVQSAGWVVHIDGVAVRVPTQPTAGKSVDILADCLHEAYVLAGVRITSGPAKLAPEHFEPLIATLQRARKIARTKWSARSHDIYRCTREAWEATGMSAPYTQVIRALRAALPEHTTLSEYNARATHTAICDLYTQAVTVFTASQRGVA